MSDRQSPIMDEADAIGAIARLIDELEPETKNRVLYWIKTRLEPPPRPTHDLFLETLDLLDRESKNRNAAVQAVIASCQKCGGTRRVKAKTDDGLEVTAPCPVCAALWNASQGVRVADEVRTALDARGREPEPGREDEQ